MTFVRWHYRGGVYVRSHYRQVGGHAGGGTQTSLLPTAVRHEQGTRTPTPAVRRRPPVPPITPADRGASRPLPFPGLELRSA